MYRTSCSVCGKEVRISDDFSDMQWEVEGRTEMRSGKFQVWVCPFCDPEHYAHKP